MTDHDQWRAKLLEEQAREAAALQLPKGGPLMTYSEHVARAPEQVRDDLKEMLRVATDVSAVGELWDGNELVEALFLGMMRPRAGRGTAAWRPVHEDCMRAAAFDFLIRCGEMRVEEAAEELRAAATRARVAAGHDPVAALEPFVEMLNHEEALVVALTRDFAHHSGDDDMSWAWGREEPDSD